MMTPDLVVLIPGFLGFSRFGNFYYFADRVAAVLRGLLEGRVGYPVPVVACTTLPTSGLVDRQVALVRTLARLCARPELGGVGRVHLVGHSTGGVDAQLLACTRPLERDEWSDEEEVTRHRLRSVVTLAAPHYGTCLADSLLARWLENPLDPTGIPQALRAFTDLVRLLPREADAMAALQPASAPQAAKFLAQIVEDRRLVRDLRPAKMEHRRASLIADPAVSLTCFVSAAPPRADVEPPSDPFYVDLYGLTRDSCPQPPTWPVARAVTLLAGTLATEPEKVVMSGRARRPVVDAGVNDGVVNTARQLVHPDRAGELGAIVVADHGDVLGHYDRRDVLMAGRPVNAGLFHSGAAFGDDEFFALYRRVADAIVRSF